ncbi:hypothetical protein KFE25_004033 [Diacronema lutheri]|uniref:Peptidase A1 domain-containing protein n=1 Tax=Diacronema lutheri TaxID=2081491 RepID=A0A8J6CBJ3_DIALT|nr:hypothetical protein KFE25_004033 [Diacronema lutheri]
MSRNAVGLFVFACLSCCALFVGLGRAPPALSTSVPPVLSDGVRLPLKVEFLWNGPSSKFGYAFLIDVAALAPAGAASLPAQWLLVDSGSSTASFCNSSFAASLQPLLLTTGDPSKLSRTVSCNKYGTDLSAPEGFWGYFYHGDLQTSDGLTMPGSYYAVMEESIGMTCSNNGFVVQDGSLLEGIFGIGGVNLDMVQQVPAGAQPSIDTCADYPLAGYQPSPLREFADGTPDSPLTHLGIRWEGGVGPNQGTLFLNGAATANENYRADDVIGPFLIKSDQWYTIEVTGFEMRCPDVATASVPFASAAANSIMDTGTPYLQFPASVGQMLFAHAGGHAGCELLVNLVGPPGSGANPQLPFNVDKLMTLMDAVGTVAGNPLVSFNGNDFILGAMGFLFFDILVYDLAANVGTAVPRADVVIPANLVPSYPGAAVAK